MVVFRADDGGSGPELWATDGTEAGTYMVKDINPAASTGSNPKYLAAMNAKVYFSDSDGMLWASDGTEGGTAIVNSSVSSPLFMTTAGALVFFVAYDGATGWEIYATDGTEAGTGIVNDINPGTASSTSIDSFVPAGDNMYFLADDGTHGQELWISDGTEAGTRMVKDINPGAASSMIDHNNMEYIDGLLFFGATDGSSGGELWVSDGTEAGTIMIEIYPGAMQGYPVT